MQDFNIIKKSDIDETFRVQKIRNDFDYQSIPTETFKGSINIPEKWNIGVIVGGSGTGKTTIAKQMFEGGYICSFEYTHKSVIDDMPNVSVDEIVKMFYSVGFGSVPSWLKPYDVLSNGEKMRVDLARAMLSNDFIVFDEFTSVVDRNVAQTTCIALNKSIKSQNKKFVAVSCHYDILDWLQPDWVFDTNKMQSFFGTSLARKSSLLFEIAVGANGKNLGVITI